MHLRLLGRGKQERRENGGRGGGVINNQSIISRHSWFVGEREEENQEMEEPCTTITIPIPIIYHTYYL
jgi:hypothetical protein